jgi:hypothetical protein
MMVEPSRLVRISWYLDDDLVLAIRHDALDKHRNFSDISVELLKKHLENPKRLKLQDWTWRGRGTRPTTVYLPPDVYDRIKTEALERGIPINRLVYSILYAKYGGLIDKWKEDLARRYQRPDPADVTQSTSPRRETNSQTIRRHGYEYLYYWII